MPKLKAGWTIDPQQDMMIVSAMLNSTPRPFIEGPASHELQICGVARLSRMPEGHFGDDKLGIVGGGLDNPGVEPVLVAQCGDQIVAITPDKYWSDGDVLLTKGDFEAVVGKPWFNDPKVLDSEDLFYATCRVMSTKIAAEILAEIDREIISDLMNCRSK